MIDFLSFPAEIRKYVYKLYFQQLTVRLYCHSSNIYAHDPQRDKNSPPSRSTTHGLGSPHDRLPFKILFVSRLVYQESSPLLLDNLTFDIWESEPFLDPSDLTDVCSPTSFVKNIKYLRIWQRNLLNWTYLNPELLKRYSFEPKDVQIIVDDIAAQWEIPDKSLGPILRSLVHGPPACQISFDLTSSSRSLLDVASIDPQYLTHRRWHVHEIDEKQAISILKRAKNQEDHEPRQLFEDNLGVRFERVTMSKDRIVLEVSKEKPIEE